MAHLDEETLVGLTLGVLSADLEHQARAHLEGCEACRQRQRNISSLVFAKTSPGAATVMAADTRPDRLQSGTPATAISRGMSLGHYVLLEKLGAGGMGEVLAAFDPRLDRKVALKLLRSGSLTAEEGKARLLREAQAMAKLQHPNVIAVHDVGTFDERVFIAMEFVEGETLSDWLRGERSWRQCVEVFVQAGQGLAAAHAAGLVHRDFKPDNVLIGRDGRPRVVDFGLARQSAITPPPQAVSDVIIPDSSLAQPLTRDGAVMGTPGYMAPEQIAGLPTDARSDQFSFCVALYEAIYGMRPFGGATLRAHASEIAEGRLLPPPGSSPVPTAIFEALKRGLANDPAQRWPDMSTLLRALEPKQRLSWRVVALVASLAVLAAIGSGLAVWQQRRLRVCGGAEKRLAGLWDDTRKKEFRAAFLATRARNADEVWKKVERSVDAWTIDWVNASRDACELVRVRKVDTEEVFELRQACLDLRLDYLRAQTNLFAAADLDIVTSAPAAVASLAPPVMCLDARALTRNRVDPSEKEATQRVQRTIHDARALLDASKYAEGVRTLEASILSNATELTQTDGYLLLGRLLKRLGKVGEAQSTFLTAAEHAIRAQDAGALARVFSWLAVVRREQSDDSADADMWMRLAHSAAARVPDDWEVLVELSLNDGILSSLQDRHAQAQKDFENALELQERHLGPHHPDVGQTYNFLGVSLTNQGKLDEAIVFYEKSLALHLELEGTQHANTASAAHNLASTLRRKGRYAEALKHYEVALEVRRALLGPEHTESLKTMEGLARTLQHLDRREEALTLVLQLLEVRRRVAGPRSKDVALTCELLAELYAAGEDWREARRAAEEELSIALATRGPDDPLIARAHLTLAEAATGLGLWAEARKSLDEALRIRRLPDGRDSAEVAIVLQAQGRLALEQKKAIEAKGFFEQALAIRERLGGATNESLASSQAGLGSALLLLEQPREAAARFEDALKLLEHVDDQRTLARARVDLGRALLLADPESRSRAVSLIAEGLQGLPGAEREQLTAALVKAGYPRDGGL